MYFAVLQSEYPFIQSVDITAYMPNTQPAVNSAVNYEFLESFDFTSVKSAVSCEFVQSFECTTVNTTVRCELVENIETTTSCATTQIAA